MFERQFLLVKDKGEVESFVLPVDWVEGESPPSMGGRTLFKFHPADNPEVRFCIFLRELELSRTASEAFRQVLYSEFHALTPDEIESLSEILEGMSRSEVFEVIESGTGYLNDRRTIRLVGNWLRQQLETLAFFLDVEGQGTHVQQIYYTAPPDLFSQFKPEARQIFDSIKWKRR